MVGQVGLDQFAFAPVAVGLFFSCTGLMEGKSVEQVKQKLNSVSRRIVCFGRAKGLMRACKMLFIPFQTINMVSRFVMRGTLSLMDFIGCKWSP
ncbi:hypothetical protein AG1IA_03067 [Rhizoctonia solani AG-1 IA]|uniref:Uncharacterized protein n=1 Tax=Thanatephorus cucumeris (strain AG1-IA) TaxID=983506 RepID=L8X1L8_THACA|nr:hypothetical protein AG1IA_03067 [Rhizoctonia solani AG-1 IA]